MQNYGGQPAQSADPNAILNECREVDRAITDLESQLDNLKQVFGQVLARPDMPSGEINNLSSQIMTSYRGLVGRVKNIKSKPESGSPRNAPQVGKVDRRLGPAGPRHCYTDRNNANNPNNAANIAQGETANTQDDTCNLPWGTFILAIIST